MSEVGALLEQLIMAPATMRLGLAKRVAEHFQAAEARLATANAENERWRAESERSYLESEELGTEANRLESRLATAEAAELVADARACIAESRLATAVGLLDQSRYAMIAEDIETELCDAIRAFLASAQPAAPACVGCTKHTTWDDCPVHQPPAPDPSSPNEVAAAKRRARALKGAATRRAQAADYSPENEAAMTYGVDDAQPAAPKCPAHNGGVGWCSTPRCDACPMNQPAVPARTHTRWCATTLASPRPCDCHPAAPARTEAEQGFTTTQLLQCSKCAGFWPHHSMVAVRTEAESNTHRRGCVCVRCEAEQAVLDACAGIPAEWLRAYLGFSLSALAAAELARREAAK